ncbi:MAG: hypothetical protein PHR63_06445 [Methanoregulaceae archaeon]|nr:hypothetical protein [Methanoregulaceae archaeon]
MAEPAGEPDHFIATKYCPEHTVMVPRCMRDLCPADRTGQSIGAEPAGYLFFGGKTGGSRNYTAQDHCFFIHLSPGIFGVHVQQTVRDMPSLCMTPCMILEKVNCVNRFGDHEDSDGEEPFESGIPAHLIRESGYRDVWQTRRIEESRPVL